MPINVKNQAPVPGFFCYLSFSGDSSPFEMSLPFFFLEKLPKMAEGENFNILTQEAPAFISVYSLLGWLKTYSPLFLSISTNWQCSIIHS